MQVPEDQLNRLRIALALLPWPPGVRTAKEAVKRLQEQFPLKDGKEEEHWKKQADEMRLKLAAMQQSSDMLRMRVLELTQQGVSNDRNAGDKRPAEAEPAEAPPKKKKKKTASPSSSSDLEEAGRQLSKLEALLARPGAPPNAPTADGHEVFAIIRGIQVIVASPGRDLELLRRSLEHGFQRIGALLSALLKCHCTEALSTVLAADIPPPVSHPALLSSISGLTSILLGHVAMYCANDSASFAQVVVDNLLSPATRSILPLSRGFLARALLAKDDTSSLVDIRSSLCDMVASILSVGDTTIKHAACQQVALDAVKGLEEAFLSDTVPRTSPALRRKYRQERLVRKDAVPHLCSILRSALSSHKEAFLDYRSPRSFYLASTTLDKLSALQFKLFSYESADMDEEVRSYKSELGVVAEEALLSVIEYAWMCCPVDDREQEEDVQPQEAKTSETEEQEAIELEHDERLEPREEEHGSPQEDGPAEPPEEADEPQEEEFVPETQLPSESQSSWWGTVMG